ncbi:MAG TPA: hypothetical protein VFF88_09640 [Methylocella sp.]|nr:hypothetical protein [Methylocella sp.]
MKVITPAAHGILDYVTVLVFLLAPAAIGLGGFAGALSYALAAIHLAMTLVTDFPLAAVRRIPFAIHGWVERIVGPVLIVLALAAGFDSAARAFYAVMGLVILLAGALTDYTRCA